MLELPSVTISKVTTLSDKCLRLQLDTRELPADTMSQIFQAYLSGQEGVKIAEIKTDTAKSPGQRLRALIWHLWNKTNHEESFEFFYLTRIERICNEIKDELI